MSSWLLLALGILAVLGVVNATWPRSSFMFVIVSWLARCSSWSLRRS